MTKLRIEKILPALVWIIGVFVVWEIGAFFLAEIFKDDMAIQKLPYPHMVIYTFVTQFPSLAKSALVTVTNAGIGFLIGSAVGIILAIILSLAGFVEKMIYPYLIVSQMIPVLGLAPIVYSIARDGELARIIISAYITFFPVSVNMLSGLKSIEPEKNELLYVNNARLYHKYFKLRIPFCAPYLFTGLKLAAPSSITAAIVVEMLGTDDGLGVKLLYSLYYGASSALMLWATIITGLLIGLGSSLLMSLLEQVIFPWRRQMKINQKTE